MHKWLKEHIDNIRNKIEVIKAHNKKLMILNYKLESFIVCLDTFAIEENEQTRVENKRKIEKNRFLESQDIEKKESIIDFTQMRQEREIRASKVSKLISPKVSTMISPKISTMISPKVSTMISPKVSTMISPVVYTPSKLNTLNTLNLGESIHNTSHLSDQNPPSQDDVRFNELVSRVISNSQGKVNKMHIIKILGMLNKSNGMLLDDVIKRSGMSKYKCIDVLNILLKTDPPAIRKKFDKGFIYFINHD